MNNIGRSVKGFCNGYFGRDSYYNRRTEGEGYDWIVTRICDDRDYVEIALFKDSEEKQKMLDEWEKESNLEDEEIT